MGGGFRTTWGTFSNNTLPREEKRRALLRTNSVHLCYCQKEGDRLGMLCCGKKRLRTVKSFSRCWTVANLNDKRPEKKHLWFIKCLNRFQHKLLHGYQRHQSTGIRTKKPVMRVTSYLSWFSEYLFLIFKTCQSFVLVDSV